MLTMDNPIIRNIRLSDYRIVGLSDCRIVGFLRRKPNLKIWLPRQGLNMHNLKFACYPNLLICRSLSSSITLIMRPSTVSSFSLAKAESVRIAFATVILEWHARSSRER